MPPSLLPALAFPWPVGDRLQGIDAAVPTGPADAQRFVASASSE